MQMSVCIKIDMKQNIARLIMALFISQRPDHGTVNIGLYQMNQYHFTPRLRFSPPFCNGRQWTLLALMVPRFQTSSMQSKYYFQNLLLCIFYFKYNFRSLNLSLTRQKQRHTKSQLQRSFSQTLLLIIS